MSWSQGEFRRINAKEVLIRQKHDDVIFTLADGTAKFSGRDYEFRESTHRREPTAENFMMNRRESQPTETTDDAEVHADFWSFQGDIIYRHHNELPVQLYVQKEETFTVPLK